MKILFAFIALLSLWSCSSVDIETYKDNQPKLSLPEFFNGQLTAHGIIKNPGGEVTRYFNATIDAYWNEKGEGVLEEVFQFDDGEEQQRRWLLVPNEQGGYNASANDVVGTSQTHVSGNAFFMEYVLRITYNEKPLDISVDDRMYLVNPNTIINESTLSKYGFTVGELVLVITKKD